MKKSHPIKINCSHTVKNILCEAMHNYTFTVLSDKNMFSATETDKLLMEIDHIKEANNIENNSPNIIDNGLQEYCHDAINYHYDQLQQMLNIPIDEQRKLMLKMLDGVPTHDEQLTSALLKDHII